MTESTTRPGLARDMARRVAQILFTIVLWGVILFAAAGRLNWNRGWIYLGLMILSIAINGVVAVPRNPEIVAERGKKHAGTKPFDRVVNVVYTIALLGMSAVAGLDAVRFGWSSIAFGWVYAGAVLYLLGSWPITWAMATNPYLETTVRIQDDRGHTVVTSGPYRLVRHPMYAGLILEYMATPLVLGSVWAFVLAATLVGILVVRTALEDRTLQDELPGYKDYAARTRYRLLPGIW